jgi:hypothetical protein
MKPDHSNDNGMKVGDSVAWLAFGWIRVPVVIEAKQGQGMTRSADVRIVDPKSLKSRKWTSTWANAKQWDNKLRVGIKTLEPL